MANFFDLLRETIGQRQSMMQEGGGFAPTAQERILNEAAIDAGAVVDDSGVYEPGIQVDGTVSRARPVDQSAYLLREGSAPDLTNTDWAQAAVDAKNKNDKEVQHKGMFGVKGTLRNVLGVLGDAFLVQGGAKPVYAPQRQLEREGDAMAGYTQSPRAAVERMTAVNPTMAREMGVDVARQEAAAMVAEAQAKKEAAVRYKQGLNILGGMAGTKGLDDPVAYNTWKSAMQKVVDGHGLGPEFTPPDIYDPKWAARVQGAALDPDQQIDNTRADGLAELTRERTEATIAQGNARVAQGDRRTDAYVERAKRPPAGRAPRAETADEMEIRIGNKDKPTAGEKAWLERRRSGSKSSGGKPRRPVNPAGTSRFR